MEFKIECTPDNAAKFADWIATRGGIAKWQSHDLGNLRSVSTPALTVDGTPTPKPGWQYVAPECIVTSADDVGVYTETLYKAFRTGLKRDSCGLTLRLSDAAQRKLDKVMAECETKHGSAHYKRGVLDIDGASMGVFYTAAIVPLSQWVQP